MTLQKQFEERKASRRRRRCSISGGGLAKPLELCSRYVESLYAEDEGKIGSAFKKIINERWKAYLMH